MLTRIEIGGFKSFRGFELDVPPFLVISGRNAAGKSNLFDAIQLLAGLAGDPVLEAAHQMRGETIDLFHQHTDGSRVERMTFAVEVLLNPTVTDAFGDTAEVSHSRLRYGVEPLQGNQLAELAEVTGHGLPAYRRWWDDTRNALESLGYRPG